MRAGHRIRFTHLRTLQFHPVHSHISVASYRSVQAMAFFRLPFLTLHSGYTRLPQFDLEGAAKDATPFFKLESDAATSKEESHTEPISGTENDVGTVIPVGHTERPTTWLKKIVIFTFNYYCAAVFFATVSAVFAGTCTWLGGWLLSDQEPYASNFTDNVVYAGALGGAIVSVAFSTTLMAYRELEAWYEKAHGIYKQPDLQDPRTWQCETDMPPQPELAGRHAWSVAKACFVLGLLVAGLLGPWVGATIIIQHGLMDSTMTALHALRCGAAGTGVVAAVALFGISCARQRLLLESGHRYIVL
ncbi:uncharacterized protein B0H18DRAFT_1043563 [Fomitopsis serialis]|uniref:uncharacterized protein n=1 Tax=Fomitopsis serialis TaxID=139415 RepID=UPI002008880E|nr:uncharacterized protein B0H18DRAFT_1043563 [Neoantrodia serialis]KAH9914986.1 hypothetical protein B0H18DRAFT_1043563 [Neoantrodia serialis]